MSDAATPMLTVADYGGLVDALRALKAHIGLSNALVDELCGWTAGHCDKLLGPSSVRAFSPKTFNDLVWVLCARVTVTLDLDRLNEMAQHYEQRCPAHTRERPNRISRKIIETAKPIIFLENARIGGRRRAECLPAKHRSQIASKAARARWRRARQEKRNAVREG